MLERRRGCELFVEKKGKINGKTNKPFDIFPVIN